jgi:hypothetical protein
MSGFTPGPWRINKDSKNTGYAVVAAQPKHHGGGTAICTVRPSLRTDDAYDEAEANARLIAAAPEMYEMTKLFARYLAYEIKKQEWDGDDEGANLKSYTLAQVRAALDKAEGATS